MQNIMDLDLKQLEAVLSEWGAPGYYAKEIFSWICRKGVVDFSAMSNLPLDLRNNLKEKFSLSPLRLVDKLASGDGTEKFLFELEDGNVVEAVSIPAPKRVTGCISSQAGCRFACKFCASGLSGFKRNLSRAEMLHEVLYLKGHSLNKPLTHIVFMGTGEPLDNYDAVIGAIRQINAPHCFHIGARRITISTCGVVPGIRRLAGEDLQIELSVSLHAADDLTRSALMPVNKIYPLRDLLAACRQYTAKTDRQITFEYVLIKGINSDLQDAEKLSKILKGWKLCKVNLIPANFVKELGIEPPDKPETMLFLAHFLKSGINATLRQPRGEDIHAACGQLRLQYEKK